MVEMCEILSVSAVSPSRVYVESHKVLYFFTVQVQLLYTCWAAGTFSCLRSRHLRMTSTPGLLARLFREVSFVSHRCSRTEGTQYRSEKSTALFNCHTSEPLILTRQVHSLPRKWHTPSHWHTVSSATYRKEVKTRLYNSHLAVGVFTKLENISESYLTLQKTKTKNKRKQ